MPRPSDDVDEFQTNEDPYPASVYPALLPNGDPHPEAGNPTPWSGQPRAVETGLATAIADGLNPAIPFPAEFLNPWLRRLSQWARWARSELRNAIDGGDSDGSANTELDAMLSVARGAVIGDPVDRTYLVAGVGNDSEATSVIGNGPDLVEFFVPHVENVSGSNYRLTGDLHLNYLTLESGAQLNLNGYRLFIRRRLTVNSGCRIYSTYAAQDGTVAIGGAGGIALSGSETTDRNGEDVVDSFGGAGGDGGGGTLGDGGTVTAPAVTLGRLANLPEALSGRLLDGTLVRGGAGGGGGYGALDDPPSGNGNGGNGGGVTIVCAHDIVNNGSIDADGEHGDAASAGGGNTLPQGGGGGGGGGVLITAAARRSGAGTYSASGGLGGSGVLGGAPGGNGEDGTVITLDL